MTKKNIWTKEETNALISIVHTSSQFDGRSTDQRLADILNQKVARRELERNQDRERPFNSEQIRRKVSYLIRDGELPSRGMFFKKRKEGMRPEEIIAWYTKEGKHMKHEPDVPGMGGSMGSQAHH